MRELAELQRRFYAIATGSAPLDDAVDLIAGEHARIDIYRRMYRDRLVDAIADDYPKLAALVRERWGALATEYLRDCPPAHPDIHQAGRRLADFLADRGCTWEVDLARLEWTRAEVFFGRDATPLARTQLESLDAAEFPTLRLRSIPASRLVELGTNADDLWSAVEDGTEPPVPEAARRTVVVWRRDPMAVIHRTLDRDEAVCVRMLANGTRFSDICEALASAADPAARAIELLVRWIDAELLDSSAIP